MNKVETKLLACLSDPDLSDSDFEQLVELLHSRDFRQIVPVADHIRRISRDVLKDAGRSRLPEGFVKHVQNLLINEGGMKPPTAVRLLLSELRDEPIPSRKWTIRSGLEFATRFASESEIVAAAQRVLAKQLSSGDKHAWSLKTPSN